MGMRDAVDPHILAAAEQVLDLDPHRHRYSPTGPSPSTLSRRSNVSSHYNGSCEILGIDDFARRIATTRQLYAAGGAGCQAVHEFAFVLQPLKRQGFSGASVAPRSATIDA